jgi:hypothetical protein
MTKRYRQDQIIRLDALLRDPKAPREEIIATEAAARNDAVTAAWWRADQRHGLPPGWTADSAHRYIAARGGVAKERLDNDAKIRGALSVVLSSEIINARTRDGKIARALGYPKPNPPRVPRSDADGARWPDEYPDRDAVIAALEEAGLTVNDYDVPIAKGTDQFLLGAIAMLLASKAQPETEQEAEPGDVRADSRDAVTIAWDTQHLATLGRDAGPRTDTEEEIEARWARPDRKEHGQ